jgi:hypothetical protein
MAHANNLLYLLNTDADQTEKSVSVDVDNVILISNDSDDTIVFTFEAGSTDDDDQLKLLTGEKVENLDVPVKVLYYKSLTGDNKNFRFYGMKKRR